MPESKEHLLSKARAKEWLFSRGCMVTRTEVPFFGGKLRLDVVGYRDGKPVIGIECGEHKDRKIYAGLPFPVFHLEYLIEPRDFGTRIKPHMGKPSRRRLGSQKTPHNPNLGGSNPL